MCFKDKIMPKLLLIFSTRIIKILWKWNVKYFMLLFFFLIGFPSNLSVSSHTPHQLDCSLNCLKVNEKVYVWPDGLAKCPGYFPASHLCSVFKNKIQSPATLGENGPHENQLQLNYKYYIQSWKLVPLDYSKLWAFPTW